MPGVGSGSRNWDKAAADKRRGQPGGFWYSLPCGPSKTEQREILKQAAANTAAQQAGAGDHGSATKE